MYNNLLVSQEGRVMTIAINRPEQSNALNTETYLELVDAFKAVDGNASVGAVVLTGKGKHFCGGGDIVNFKRLIESGEYFSEEAIRDTACACAEVLRNCSKPVVAAVNGAAVGAGISLAAGCDFRVVEPSSKLSMAFINMALPGDTGGIFFLVRLLGVAKATELMMTGDFITGEQAVSCGLANELAEEGTLYETAFKLAKKLANKSTAAIAAQKMIINKYFFGDKLREYYRDEQIEMHLASLRGDFREATYAFLEKRKPEFNK